MTTEGCRMAMMEPLPATARPPGWKACVPAAVVILYWTIPALFVAALPPVEATADPALHDPLVLLVASAVGGVAVLEMNPRPTRRSPDSGTVELTAALAAVVLYLVLAASRSVASAPENS